MNITLVSSDHRPVGLLSPGGQPAWEYEEMQAEDKGVYWEYFESGP